MANQLLNSYLRPRFSANQMAAATNQPSIYDKAAQLYLSTAPQRYQTALSLDAMSRTEAENEKNRAMNQANADRTYNLSQQGMAMQKDAWEKSQPTVAGQLAKAGMLGLTQLDKITKGYDWLKDKWKTPGANPDNMNLDFSKVSDLQFGQTPGGAGYNNSSYGAVFNNIPNYGAQYTEVPQYGAIYNQADLW